MNTVVFDPIDVPLRVDAQGAIRVGGTRVLLDLVIHEFQNGASPEEIVEAFDALALPDVYAVLSHYLRNPSAIDEYLGRREKEAAAVRRKIEASPTQRADLRSKLLARMKGQENGSAAPD
jgi:uncharacterized protein (DUF433 family)